MRKGLLLLLVGTAVAAGMAAGYALAVSGSLGTLGPVPKKIRVSAECVNCS